MPKNALCRKTNEEVNTISSLEVSEMMEVQHAEILKKLEGTTRADGSVKTKGIIPVLSEGNFPVADYFIESTYIDAQGKPRKCYDCTRMGCDFLANKFTGEKGIIFTAKYVDKFDKMEQALKEQQTLPQNLSPQLQFMINMELEQKKIKQQLEVVTYNTKTAVSKVEEVEYKLDKQMTINATQQKHIQDAVKKKVYERLQCCKDFDLSFDTAEHKAQFFSSLYGDLKKRFGVPTYRDILFVDYEAALTYVKAWIEPADIRG